MRIGDQLNSGKATRTESKIFIETCAAVWRALTVLDDVSLKYPEPGDWNDGCRNDVYEKIGNLECMLDRWIERWNDTCEDRSERIDKCRSVMHGVEFDTRKCELFVCGRQYCPTCDAERLLATDGSLNHTGAEEVQAGQQQRSDPLIQSGNLAQGNTAENPVAEVPSNMAEEQPQQV